ncbi:hypothetical protein ACTGJ9_025370 [Bradyrhizobium sp. RDM12]
MRDIQIDRSQVVPSILPADIPGLSDDECLAWLARAVETPIRCDWMKLQR